MFLCRSIPLKTGIVDSSDLPGVGTIEGAEAIVAPPPAPTPPPAPVHVGGHVRAPEKVVDVPTRYPGFAHAAGVQGVVIVEATIGVDGRVQRARLLRSVPLLDEAALAAVRNGPTRRPRSTACPCPSS